MTKEAIIRTLLNKTYTPFLMEMKKKISPAHLMQRKKKRVCNDAILAAMDMVMWKLFPFSPFTSRLLLPTAQAQRFAYAPET